MLKLISITSILLILFNITIAQKKSDLCKSQKYEDLNQLETERFSLEKIRGKVVAVELNNRPYPEVCLLLFNEKDHQLVTSFVTNKNAEFGVRGIRNGLYRLVVRSPNNAVLPANIALQIDKKLRSKARLIINMKGGNIDSPSYGELEKDQKE
jgi:hypothetical protein